MVLLKSLLAMCTLLVISDLGYCMNAHMPFHVFYETDDYATDPEKFKYGVDSSKSQEDHSEYEIFDIVLKKSNEHVSSKSEENTIVTHSSESSQVASSESNEFQKSIEDALFRGNLSDSGASGSKSREGDESSSKTDEATNSEGSLESIQSSGINPSIGYDDEDSELGSGSGDDYSLDDDDDDDRTLREMCTHTGSESFPWWRVDLGLRALVTEVKIYNRAQGLSDRLHDIEIRVSDAKNPSYLNSFIGYSSHRNRESTSLLCARIEGSLPPGESDFHCGKEGRYVSVQIVKAVTNTWYNVLTLCELEVFGTPLPITESVQPTLLSTKKSTQQSSTSWNGESKLAVDGVITAHYYMSTEDFNCIQQDNRILNEDVMKNNGTLYSNCADIYKSGFFRPGIYYIQPKVEGELVEPFQVYCEKESGEGFTVIHNRHYYLHHSEDFSKTSFDHYIHGFGDLCLEFWIGAEKLHLLTQKDSQLVVEVTDSWGIKREYRYESFKVDDSKADYKVHFAGPTFNSSAQNFLDMHFKSENTFKWRQGHGAWWWTDDLSEGFEKYCNPNGELWKGKNISNAVTWGNDLSSIKPNYYIQFLRMKLYHRTR